MFPKPQFICSKLFWTGIALLVCGGIPTVQQFRDYQFTRAGMDTVIEHSFVSLPITFGMHSIAITDTLPRLSRTSQTQIEATVTVLVDSQVLLPPIRAMVRPGGVDFGRYHGWISVRRFTEIKTGSRFILIASRPGGQQRGRTEFEMARIDEKGTISTFKVNGKSRRENYPVSRVTDPLNWDGKSLFPLSDWPWPFQIDLFPFNLFQAMAPYLAAIAGFVMVVLAVRRSQPRQFEGMSQG